MKRSISILSLLAFTLGYSQDIQAVNALTKETNANITISKSTSNPNFIRFENGNLPQLKSAKATVKVEEFLSKHYKAFNLTSAKDMVLVEDSKDNYGFKNVVFRQYYKGVPVYDGILKFNFNNREDITSINGNTISNIKVSTTPSISASQAASIAKDLIVAQNLNKSNSVLEISKNNLLIFPKNLAQGGVATPYLAYEVEITNKNDVREFLFINAHTGELVEQFTGIHAIDRKLYETNTNTNNLKWKEGDALPGSLNIWQRNEVITSGHVYNFFKNAFGFISFDNNDRSMITINNNPNINCPNANWNGITANYCNGTASDDVVAHEWGHAYTEYTSKLIYNHQAGALNESYSDVWGETIDLLNDYNDEGENLAVRTTSQCSESTRWKMGEKASAFGNPIRDMWNPNCNGDPAYVLDATYYYCGSSVSAFVHKNSGVPNHLYALLVDGGSFRGYNISGIGFVKAAHLWWRAQKNYLTQTSDFVNFADALEASVNDLVGVNLEGLSTTETPAGPSGQSFTVADIQNIKNAILSVQLRESTMTQCNYKPLLASTPELCSNAVDGSLFKETWENGLGNWTVSNLPTNSSSWIDRNWVIKNNLPNGRSGNAMYGTAPVIGDCSTSIQNGILRLESPLISFPTITSGKYEMAFNHYVATEETWDGGNIKYSLNGGAWTLLPRTAFTQNPYNKTLDNTNNSDNPMKGQAAFTGTDAGGFKGSWGQSVIDLSKIGVTSGSNIKFRFELGTDGCNGIDGWYLDEIYVYNCSANLAVNDVQKDNGLQAFPNPTSGLVTIQNNQNLKLKNVDVYSSSGQLIKTFNLDKAGKSSVINLSSLVEGVYVLKINSEKESTNIKIIKK